MCLTCSIYYLRHKGESDDLNAGIINRQELFAAGLAETAKEVLIRQERKTCLTLSANILINILPALKKTFLKNLLLCRTRTISRWY
jgi:hypothetical protein